MKKEENKTCINCGHFVPIGEGEFICNLEEPVLVMEDYVPNENYIYCGLEDWEEE